ncbi:MAG: MBL fold metallo-hydrolase [Caldilineales bacterium]|nr:MBL fold metallo-hydrolase [Caldilineales bacterium]
MTELLPGLHQIRQILGPRYLHQYLLVGERSLLLDTGIASSPGEYILPTMRSIGFDPADLDFIMISHADVDHMGGNSAMRQASPQSLLACHYKDAPWIGSRSAIMAERYGWYRQFDMDYDAGTWEWIDANIGPDVRVDLELSGDETIWLGGDRPVRVLNLPGHSPGHIGLYDEANRAAIIIDAVLWRGLLDMDGNIVHPPPYFQIRPYLDSIDLLLSLDFEHLYTGHYHNMSGANARQWLTESKAHVQDSHAAIAGILQSAGRPLTLPEAHALANETIGPYEVFVIELAGPVYAHLQQLVAEGEASRVEMNGKPAWVAV